jgi:hypothetical protein
MVINQGVRTQFSNGTSTRCSTFRGDRLVEGYPDCDGLLAEARKITPSARPMSPLAAYSGRGG